LHRNAKEHFHLFFGDIFMGMQSQKLVSRLELIVTPMPPVSGYLVVFDGRVEGLASLQAALLPGVESAVVDAETDGLLAITQQLAQRKVSRLAIVAHGEPGRIALGAQVIDVSTLKAQAGLLQEWCVAEIALYSCEVGVDAAFICCLEELTGASIAASSQKVGSSDWGGSWQLEPQAAEPFVPDTLAEYVGLLATFTGGVSNDVADAVTGTLTGFTGGTLSELQDELGDRFDAGAGDDIVVGGSGNDYLSGSEGNDSLIGGVGNDTLIGDAGDDIFADEDGSDVVDGGVGDDLYELYLESATRNIVVTAGQFQDLEAARIYTGLGDDVINISSVTSSNVWGFSEISTGAGNDMVVGSSGDDSLDGGEGSDILVGSNGDLDTLIGGAGDDVYEFYTNNTITENAGGGIDWVYAGSDSTLEVNLEKLVLWGTGNIDGTGNNEDNILYGNDDNNQLNGGAGIDYLLGGDGTDTLSGDAGNDGLIGGTGNDFLTGGEGSDTLIGSNGDLDTLIGGTGDDVYEVYTNNTITENAGEGIDWVYAVVDYTLGVNLEKLVLWETANINGTGNSEDNYLYGNVGNNQLAGGTGNDSLFGGAGEDSLTGGLGNDEFIFRGVFGSLGVDIVTDFTLSADKITLSKATFNLSSAVTTGVDFGFSVSGEFASVTSNIDTSSALIVYNSSTGGLFYNPNGSDVGFGSGGQFAVITGNPVLTATDFKLVS
jgi:Ca2+-binding RTX toxin-like protein